MNKYILNALTIAAFPLALSVSAQRTNTTLNDGWQFAKGESATWQNVRVPHDWAIYGPFGREYDLQVVAVEQNGETEKTEKTGRTGGLPYYGKGEYKTTFNVADTTGRSVTLLFDGAMSNARVFVNDIEIGNWAYGYNSFYLNADKAIRQGENTLHVMLENKPESSRWYPGAGLYRNVHVIETAKIHIPVWGTYVTTPHVESEYATVNLKINIDGTAKGQVVDVITDIVDAKGKVVATNTSHHASHGQIENQNFIVNNPQLWSPESPTLYTAKTRLVVDGNEVDSYDTRFGIRSIEYIPTKGFFLNGKVTKFRGVCNHHDLGPLGAAVNRSALRHQLELLKDMGANAIRTSHNMPAPELVELCDEMGLMLMVEPFDDWAFRPKCKNGYGSIFNEWAERDMINMLHHYRNNPSVVLWSIGNEVPSQWGPDGVKELTMLQDIAHREDPTRPVTCGMDQIKSVLDNGFAATLDIPGFNYKPQYYQTAYDKLPQKLVLGSETASTVSSRGVYKFPAELKSQAMYDDNQSSSYDTEYCYWSNIPDIDFAADDDLTWEIGQFVWTGFDYLGEPTPYDTDAWPSHSSLFGIIDLASLPKDRYYLYRSKWNENDATLHILPHWNWAGREGQVTPVMVYTSYPKAELFINGESQGVRCKNDSTVMNRYRLMWNETRYTPGEVKVVAYDNNGNIAATETVRTAGKAHHLVLSANRTELSANGDDLVYITVQVADKDGNIVPTDNRMVKFETTGAGKFEATANGDATCLLPFQKPEMQLFSGAATAIVRSSDKPGVITFRAKAAGVKSANITITVK
jgi:beta-galactosidase